MKLLLKDKRNKTILIAFLIIVANILIALDVRDDHMAKIFLPACTILSFSIYLQLFDKFKKHRYQLTLPCTYLAFILFYFILFKTNSESHFLKIYILPMIVNLPVSLLFIPVSGFLGLMTWGDLDLIYYDLFSKLLFIIFGTLQYRRIGSKIDNRKNNT